MEYQILHPGPYLSRDDIEPYITKDKTKSIFSTVRGAVGVIRLYNKGRYLIAENGKRLIDEDAEFLTQCRELDKKYRDNSLIYHDYKMSDFNFTLSYLESLIGRIDTPTPEIEPSYIICENLNLYAKIEETLEELWEYKKTIEMEMETTETHRKMQEEEYRLLKDERKSSEYFLHSVVAVVFILLPIVIVFKHYNDILAFMGFN